MLDLIDEAVKALREGHLVAIPTETVYGLAADASNRNAINQIFSTKGRPAGHPLIVHIAKPSLLLDKSHSQNLDDAWREILLPWARDVSPATLALAKTFWPGPLTLILPKAKDVLTEITGGQETVGVRCPDHVVAQTLIERFEGGLAAPSANRFGKISPTTAQHVRDEFSDESLLILDGGPCEVGIESTIVDLSRWDTHGPVILRPGAITQVMIHQALHNQGIDLPQSVEKVSAKGAPRVSGSLSAHYAPRTKMTLYEHGDLNQSLEILSRSIGEIKNLAWVHFSEHLVNLADSEGILFLEKSKITEIIIPPNPEALARQLYSLLRHLDQSNYDLIAFQKLPIDASWDAVRDRLSRAEVGSGN
jgi:L-threonylcarbamoyladenylate synthase